MFHPTPMCYERMGVISCHKEKDDQSTTNISKPYHKEEEEMANVKEIQERVNQLKAKCERLAELQRKKDSLLEQLTDEQLDVFEQKLDNNTAVVQQDVDMLTGMISTVNELTSSLEEEEGEGEEAPTTDTEPDTKSEDPVEVEVNDQTYSSEDVADFYKEFGVSIKIVKTDEEAFQRVYKTLQSLCSVADNPAALIQEHLHRYEDVHSQPQTDMIEDLGVPR